MKRNKSLARISALFSEYPFLLTQDSIYGCVTNVYVPPFEITNTDSIDVYVEIDGFKKKFVDVGRETFDNKTKLKGVLLKDSWIRKKTNNDTVQIFRIIDGDTLKYYFLIQDQTGNPYVK